MISEKNLLFAASLMLVGAVGFEAWQVDRAQRAAEGWKQASESWERSYRDMAKDVAKTMGQYHDLVWSLAARVRASADDAAVCTSMLPAEQRRSFTGTQP